MVVVVVTTKYSLWKGGKEPDMRGERRKGVKKKVESERKNGRRVGPTNEMGLQSRESSSAGEESKGREENREWV